MDVELIIFVGRGTLEKLTPENRNTGLSFFFALTPRALNTLN